MDLKQTPLTEEHKKLGAQMGPFGGWLMPIQYSGILTEHAWTRQQVSLFDICHMGEFLIYGDPQKSGLNRIVSANLEVMSVGSCRYTSMLNEAGGIIDDLIVYRLKPDQWMFVVNASRIDIDAAHIKRYLSKDAKFEDLSARLGKLDLQGPRAYDVLRQLLGPGISALTYYTFDHFVLLGENNVVSRTGYTGELGYELYLSNEKITDLWKLLLKDNLVKPAGLGARDTLRLEMGYTLYGQDIDENITPLEAGMEKFIDLKKDFIGRDALIAKQKSGDARKLVYFAAESRRAPRHNYKIYSGTKEIGVVTSGSFSPSLSYGIGMGYVTGGYDLVGTKISVRDNTDKSEILASIINKPFYRRSSLKK
ncbi:MAG: glycine cleavage system aminomethyltransferase GcvT [Candidatus Omnitrophota bacterium]|jgi:aminomethyltransferase